MSEKLKLGIDIDEVVVEFVKSFLNFFEEKMNKKVSYEEIISYSFEIPFGMNKKEIHDLIHEHSTEDNLLNLDLVEHSKESILDLTNDFDICFVTSRHLNNKIATIKFFEKHFPENNFKFFFAGDAWGGAKSKYEIAKELNLKYFVEDNFDYALSCANVGIKTFLLDKPWNQNSGKHENITRVKNWKEILEKLK